MTAAVKGLAEPAVPAHPATNRATTTVAISTGTERFDRMALPLALAAFVTSLETPPDYHTNDDPDDSEDKAGKETPEGHYAED